MTSSDRNPGFKVTVYLQVEYLKNVRTKDGQRRAFSYAGPLS